MPPLLPALTRELRRRLQHLRAVAWLRLAPRRAAALRARGSWLLGAAAGTMYGDNAAALHAHLRRHHPELDVYWVIDRDSPDVERARAVGPVLFRGDWRTYAHALVARVVAISHGAHDVPGCASAACGAFRVRLGHGITALKKTKPRALHTNESANAIWDLVPVASAAEAANKREWGIRAERLVVTGVPRFDALLAAERATPADPRRIVYMPTWRDAISAGDPAARDRFFGELRALLDAPDAIALLDAHDAHVDLVLHMNLRAHAAAWTRGLANPRVHVVDGSADPQPLFVRAGALVTDYSSVTWDFLYAGKPVLFHQFDRAAFDAARGGYVGDERPLPGPVSHTAPDAIANLARHLDGRLARDAELAARVTAWTDEQFAFRDADNCARVTRAILERIA